jgi:hypothetical protein
MQRSFVARTTVNFPDWELYVRVGDILVYNATNENSLIVYRGGAIIKTIRTTPISIAAMLKTKMIEEVLPKLIVAKPLRPSLAPKPVVKAKASPKAVPAPKPAILVNKTRGVDPDVPPSILKPKKLTVDPSKVANEVIHISKED